MVITCVVYAMARLTMGNRCLLGSAMAWKKISEVSRVIGLSERRIREYERAGLIRPRREPRTNDRLFGPVEVSQLTVLKRLVNENKFTLENLRVLLAYAPCWALTDCKVRDRCPVLRDPATPCYLQPEKACIRDGDCLRCPIYLSKEQPREALIVRSDRIADESSDSGNNVRTH